MNAIEILNTIRQAGGTVQAVDGDLRISVPAGTITDENRAVLSEAKADLVRLLAPADPEREAIQWSDTPAADQALDQARREWAEIVGRGPHDCLDRFGDPTLTNAERQHDRNAWANRARLRRRAKTGTGGTEKDLVFREIELILEETFAEHGIEIEAEYTQSPEAILVETTRDSDWTEPGRGKFVIPAGTQGRLVGDLHRELGSDEGRTIEALMKRERRAGGRDPVAVWLDGRVRVMDRKSIRLLEATRYDSHHQSHGPPYPPC